MHRVSGRCVGWEGFWSSRRGNVEMTTPYITRENVNMYNCLKGGKCLDKKQCTNTLF